MAHTDDVQPAPFRPVTPEDLWLHPELRGAAPSLRGSAVEAGGPRVAVRFEGAANGILTIVLDCAAQPAAGGVAKRNARAPVYTSAQPQVLLTPAVANGNLGEMPAGAWSRSAIGATVGNPGTASNGCLPLLILLAIVLGMALISGGTLRGAPRSGVSTVQGSAPAQNADRSFAGGSGGYMPAASAQPVPAQAGPVQAVNISALPRAGSAVLVLQPPVQQDAGCANSGSAQLPAAPFCGGQPAIKGVCDPVTGRHLYYFPGQLGYIETVVGRHADEAYFCTFSDAAQAGYTLAP